MRRALVLLTIFLVSLPLQAAALAPPLDGDARSGRDAGDSAETAVHVEPGRHNATIATAADTVDTFVFDATVGQALSARAQRSELRTTVTDPLGGSHVGYAIFVAPATGTYVVRVELKTPYAGRYSLEVQRIDLAPQDDAGSGGDAGDARTTAVALTEGNHTGSFDVMDSSDLYVLSTTIDEVIRIRLGGDPGSWSYLYTQGRYLGDIKRPEHPVTGDGGPLYLNITRNFERPAASYFLDIERTPSDATPTPGAFTPVLRGLGGGDLDVLPDGSIVATGGNAVWRLTTAGAEVLLHDAYGLGGGGVAVDADGRVIHERYGTAYRREADGSDTPVGIADGRYAFGPDGLLHVLAPEGWHHSISADRDGFDGGRWYRGAFVAFHPDGRGFWSDAQRGAIVTWPGLDCWCQPTKVATVPGSPQGLAFGMDGRLYVANDSGTVFRLDLGTGAQEVIATGLSAPVQLQFSGTRLWAASGRGSPDHPLADTVSYLDVGAQGFEGYHPAFDLPPLADLTVRIIDERPAEGSTERIVTFEVENVGGSYYHGNWYVTFSPEGPVGNLLDSSYHYARGGLAAGEVRTFELRWDPTYHLGDQKLRGFLHMEWGVEGDSSNNYAEYQTYAYVSGTGRVL